MKKKRSRGKIAVVIIAAALIGGGAGYTFLNSRNTGQMAANVREAAAERGNIERTVSGTGHLKLATSDDIMAPAGIEIEKVLVEEGDTIKAGMDIATVKKLSVEKKMLAVDKSVESKKDEIDELDKDAGTYSLEKRVLEGEIAELEKERDKLQELFDRGTIRSEYSGVVQTLYIEDNKEISAGGASSGSNPGSNMDWSFLSDMIGSAAPYDVSVQDFAADDHSSPGTIVVASVQREYLMLPDEEEDIFEYEGPDDDESDEPENILVEVPDENTDDNDDQAVIDDVVVETEPSADSEPETDAMVQQNADDPGTGNEGTEGSNSGQDSQTGDTEGTDQAGSGDNDNNTASQADGDAAADGDTSEAGNDGTTADTGSTPDTPTIPGSTTAQIDPSKLISEVSLSVTAPAIGGIPQTTLEDSDHYTGKLSWQPQTQAFTPGTIYVAIADLAAEEGYSFNPDVRLLKVTADSTDNILFLPRDLDRDGRYESLQAALIYPLLTGTDPQDLPALNELTPEDIIKLMQQSGLLNENDADVLKKLLESGSLKDLAKQAEDGDTASAEALAKLLGIDLKEINDMINNGTLSDILSDIRRVADILASEDGLSSLLGQFSNFANMLNGANYASMFGNMGDLSSLFGGAGDLSSMFAGASGLSLGSGGSSSYSASEATAAVVTPSEKMLLEIAVDELDILSVKKGQDALVSVNAIEDETFNGVISDVATSANEGTGSAKYNVKIEVDRTDNMLEGMSASAEIAVGSASSVLMIPVEALQYEEGRTFVYTALDSSGNPAQDADVETGLSDSTYVEITAGLAENDKIYYTVSGVRKYDIMENMNDEIDQQRNDQ